jgi:beta-glucanase (GH16 family)
MKLSAAIARIFLGCAAAGSAFWVGTPLQAQTTAEEFKSLAWNTSHAGEPLDLTGYHRTFFDDFNAMSVTAANGAGPWYAAVHSAFGASTFLPPGPEGTYRVDQGKLTIRAQKTDGRWTSGLIQTVNKNGDGFAQQYGYFEMKAKFPPGPGGWPAFWLLTQNGLKDKAVTRGEIDLVEWYGNDPKRLHTSVHLWPAEEPGPGALARHVGQSQITKIGPALVNGELQGFHTYGGKITPDWIIVYFDGKECARFKTLPEYRTPVYLVVNLAIFAKEADLAQSPKNLVIDSVSAYAAP